MKIKNIAGVLILAIVLSGCGMAYNIKRNEMLKTATEADFGLRPPENHQEIEKQMVLDELKDPDSAKFDFSDKLNKTTIPPSGYFSSTPILVWLTMTKVNAKNSYGGYTGFQYYAFAWRDGKVIAISWPFKSLESPVVWNYLP